jgi:hypothetical protein
MLGFARVGKGFGAIELVEFVPPAAAFDDASDAVATVELVPTVELVSSVLATSLVVLSVSEEDPASVFFLQPETTDTINISAKSKDNSLTDLFICTPPKNIEIMVVNSAYSYIIMIYYCDIYKNSKNGKLIYNTENG